MNPAELGALPPARLPFPVTRALDDPIAARSADDGLHMVGHFSTFNDWYEVDSVMEGHFLERVSPGAFRKTIAESAGSMKVLFNHGQDPQMGNMVLGSIRSLAEDKTGPAYDVGLFDGLPPLLVSGLRAEPPAYGSSHRFHVMQDSWDQHPDASEYNPDGIPERTISEARVFEFGPVTFPADPQATAGIRSTTDAFYRATRDPETFESLMRSAQVARTPKGAAIPEPPPDTPPEPSRSDTPPDPPQEAAPAQDPPEGGSSDSRSVSVTEYVSIEEKVSRLNELEDAIKREAVEFAGVMPPDKQAAYDAHKAEAVDLKRDVLAWEERQADLRRFAGEPTNIDRGAPNVVRSRTVEDIHDITAIRANTRSREEYNDKVKEYALRSIDTAKVAKGANLQGLVDVIENRDAGEEGEGEIARRILITGSPAYKRAYSKFLVGQKDLWTQEEARAAALAVTGTTTTGGFAVPYVFDPTILNIGVYTAQNPYRSACRVETITNGNNWRTVTVGAVTSLYVAEAAAATEQGPTFGQPTYTVQRAHAFATVSHETLMDRPDIAGELSSVFAESKATYEENQFTLGTGAGVFPQGMFRTTAYTATTTATNDVTALADTQLVEAALPLRHRANGNWFMNRSTLRQLLVLDTTNRYFSGAGIQFPGQQNPVRQDSGNTGISLLGYPVWETPSAVSTLTTDAAIIAVFCDPRSYIIVDRLGMNVEVIQNMLDGATPSFPTGQRGIYMYWRNTAKPINADAGRQLTVQ